MNQVLRALENIPKAISQGNDDDLMDAFALALDAALDELAKHDTEVRDYLNGHFARLDSALDLYDF